MPVIVGEFVFDILEGSIPVAAIGFTAYPVSGSIVIIGHTRLVVRLPVEVAAPVSFLPCRIEMLGHFFAAQPACDRTNGRTYNSAYGPGSERSGRRTGSDGTCGCSKSDATCGCSKAYSNRMRTWDTSDRVAVRPRQSCIVIFHIPLRCTVEYGASTLAKLRSEGNQRIDESNVGHRRSLAEATSYMAAA
jgi:hypothetical protein